MTRIIILLALLLTAACAHEESHDSDSTPTVSETKGRYVDRLFQSGFIREGFPVSLNAEGQPDHLGEGILWWGVAEYALAKGGHCDKAQELESGVMAMLDSTGGGLLRIVPIGEYAGGREITFDGAVGFYLGVTAEVVFCNGLDRWKPYMSEHLAYLALHGNELYEGTGAFTPPGFTYVRDRLAFAMGLRDEPDPEDFAALEVSMPSWVGSVKAEKGVCYPANLSYLSVLTLRALGRELGAAGKGSLCAVTNGGDIPTLDDYCGRKPLSDYVEGFTENLWEFRHQRCLAEGADGHGDQGWQTPALDLLLAIVEGYSPPQQAVAD